MTKPPLETMGEEGTPSYLEQRDPMLAHALRLHGREWRPDLSERLEIPRRDDLKLPGVVVTTLEHSLEWPDGNGVALYRQRWQAKIGEWQSDLTMRAMPDAIAMAIMGHPLTDVINAPGAEAWIVEKVELVPEQKTILILGRIGKQGKDTP